MSQTDQFWQYAREAILSSRTDRPVQAIAPCAATVGRGGPCAEVAGKWRSLRTG